MAHRSGRATIVEVATAAGVSPATVSRVMNGRFAGEPEVADRVRRAAAELAYAPNHLARSLALGETTAIALVVPDLANPAFQEVMAGLTRSAARDGYRILVADSAESPEEEPPLASEIRRRCDAIVLCAPRMAGDVLAGMVTGLQPLVLVNRPGGPPGVPSPSIDYRRGIVALARHLYELGHREVAYLGGPPLSASNISRARGLTDAERLLPGLRLRPLGDGASARAGLAAADAVRRSGVTAVMAYNDLGAIGVMHGLRALGLRVPEDVSVTGFDDVPLARFLSPPLTTAAAPYEQLGEEAWSRMRALLRGEPPEPDVLLDARLELRGTTAPPGR